jgi:hypothetical protein
MLTDKILSEVSATLVLDEIEHTNINYRSGRARLVFLNSGYAKKSMLDMQMVTNKELLSLHNSGKKTAQLMMDAIHTAVAKLEAKYGTYIGKTADDTSTNALQYCKACTDPLKLFVLERNVIINDSPRAVEAFGTVVTVITREETNMYYCERPSCLRHLLLVAAGK